MLSFLYIISMAISFTNMFNGELTPFYVKYIVAILWILLWLFDFGIVKKRLLVCGLVMYYMDYRYADRL